MHRRIGIALAAAAIGLLTLAGCSSGAGGNLYSHSTTSSSTGSSTGALAGSVDLKTASTSLGTVVVDGKGLTVYVFDKDTANSGKSACSGVCAKQWPAVTTTSSTPSVTGVTGKVGTFSAAAGGEQVTLNGLPLYTYAGDSSAGDVMGQGIAGSWWVVGPDGTKMTAKSGGGY